MIHFCKTKDAQRIKFLKRQIIARQKQIRERRDQVKSEEEVDLERKKFIKSVHRIIERSPKNTKRNINRKLLFTPESALLALPSLQISTVIPKTNQAEEQKKYFETQKKKDKLRLTREKLKNSTKNKFITFSPVKPKIEKLDISISSRADKCGDRFTKTSHEIKHRSRKQTVFSNKPQSCDLVSFLL